MFGAPSSVRSAGGSRLARWDAAVLFAALGAAAGETGALFAGGEAHSAPERALLAGLALGVWGWAAIPLSLAAMLFARAPAVRDLVAAIPRVLAHPDAPTAVEWTLGAVLGGLAAGLGITFGAWVGVSLIGAVTAPFAAIGVACATVAASGGVLALGVEPTRAGARWFRRRANGKGWVGALFHPAVPVLGLGLAATLAASRIAGEVHGYAIAGATLGLAPLLFASSAARLRRLLCTRRVVSVYVLWSVGALATPALYANAGDRVVDAIAYRAPYVSPILTAARDLMDHDGDGFAAALHGGDCDDSDPAIHPSAFDQPGNGIDENCSGEDAQRFEAPKPPEGKRPADLAPQPPIVMILIDALRPDHLGFAGYGRPTSPNIDGFRKTATWFENAYTPAPSTRFALASLFTGLDPIHLPYKGGRGNAFRLEQGTATLARRLSAAGYDTHGFTISYVLQHNKGTGQGFAEWTTPWPAKEWREAHGRAAEMTTDTALDYLRAHSAIPAGERNPYLLFTHYRCTHDPYVKHPEWDFGNAPMDRYDSALAYCDVHIGRLLDALRETPGWDDTVVVMFSDHGELFGEHGLTSHGNSIYEPDVRSLLLLRVPGFDTATVGEPVRLTDLMPTMLQLASLEVPDGLDGWSLLPLLDGDAGSRSFMDRPNFLFTDLRRGNVRYRAAGVLRWPYKLIRDLGGTQVAVYDVVDDPGETRDLSGEAPVTQPLAATLEAWLATNRRHAERRSQ